MDSATDLIFNCQMGRGRTTTGMVCASLVATVLYGDYRMESVTTDDLGTQETFVMADGVSEEEAYLNGV